MSLRERCVDCGWIKIWDGGSAADDPGITHLQSNSGCETVCTTVVEVSYVCPPCETEYDKKVSAILCCQYPSFEERVRELA